MKRKPKKEPPIDCDCGDDVGWGNAGYCVHCGGYLPDNPKHKNNWKPQTDLSLEQLFEIGIRGHLAGGMIKNEDGTFVLTTDLTQKVREWIRERLPKEVPKYGGTHADVCIAIGQNMCLKDVKKALLKEE